MPDALRELKALLQLQRTHLLRGELDALGAISLGIQDLAQEATAAGSAKDLLAIKALASANAPLIAAALRGVQAARKRLAEIAGHCPATATYAADGTAVTYGRDPVAFERRL